MINWLHKLFNPHCEHCVHEQEELRICNTCEVLKSQVTRLQYENEKLLERLLNPIETKEPEPIKSTEEYKPLPKQLTWAARKQMLENEDRAAAKIINSLKEENAKLKLVNSPESNELNKSTDQVNKLEKELGISSSDSSVEERKEDAS